MYLLPETLLILDNAVGGINGGAYSKGLGLQSDPLVKAACTVDNGQCKYGQSTCHIIIFLHLLFHPIRWRNRDLQWAFPHHKHILKRWLRLSLVPQFRVKMPCKCRQSHPKLHHCQTISASPESCVLRTSNTIP